MYNKYNAFILQYNNLLGQELRRIREQAGYTIQVLANHLGYFGETRIKNIESAKYTITLDILIDYSCFFGFPLHELFAEVDKKIRRNL